MRQCLLAKQVQVLYCRALFIFLKSPLVIGLDYSTATGCKVYPEPTIDAEQIFGSVRYHHRRCSGRKVAPASLVLRGSVQLIACVATHLTTWGAEQLATVSIKDWRSLRSQLEQHRIHRVEQRRFRRSPADYLANLESQLV